MIKQLIQTIMETAFGDSDLQAGCTDEQLLDVESCLGFALPEPLRDFHAVAGRHQAMMDADYHVVPLDKLTVKDNCLIVCEENQWTAEWGIELKSLKYPNPQVVARPQGQEKWSTESMKTSAHLINLGSWQAIMSVEEVARIRIPEEELSSIEKHFEYIGDRTIRSGAQEVSFIDVSHRILACYQYMTELLYVGAPREGGLEALEERTGLEFDWL